MLGQCCVYFRGLHWKYFGLGRFKVNYLYLAKKLFPKPGLQPKESSSLYSSFPFGKWDSSVGS